MPPAFNLSQDQTLQFNLCKKLILTLDPMAIGLTPIATGPAFQCEHYEVSSTRACSTPGRPTPSTHTYRLFKLLKSGVRNTDAEKRDYTAKAGRVNSSSALFRSADAQKIVRSRAATSRGGRVFLD